MHSIQRDAHGSRLPFIGINDERWEKVFEALGESCKLYAAKLPTVKVEHCGVCGNTPICYHMGMMDEHARYGMDHTVPYMKIGIYVEDTLTILAKYCKTSTNKHEWQLKSSGNQT